MREERKRFKKIMKSLRNLGGWGPKTWRNEEIGPTVSRPRDGVAKMGLRGHNKHLRIKQHRIAKLCRTKLLKRRDLLWEWKMTKWKRKEHTKRDNKLKLRIAVLNVKGINEPAKRWIIEEWAANKRIDFMILVETQHAHSAQEGGTNKKDGDDMLIESQWKWYFRMGVDPRTHDEISRKCSLGSKLSAGERNQAREHAGVACLSNKSLWDKVQDVQPVDGRIMKCKLNMSREINITIA